MREFELNREPYELDTMELVGEIRKVANQVVFRGAWRGTGRGPDLNMEVSVLIAMRDAMFFDVEYFWDNPEAFDAAGLPE